MGETDDVEHTQQVTPDAIMQLGFGFWGSKTPPLPRFAGLRCAASTC